MSSQSIQVIQHNFLPPATSPQVASKFWGPVLGRAVGEACVHFLCPVGKVPRANMPLLSGNVWKWIPHLSGARYLLPFLLFLPRVVTVQAPCWGWGAGSGFWNISIFSSRPEKPACLSLGHQPHLGLLLRTCTWPRDRKGEAVGQNPFQLPPHVPGWTTCMGRGGIVSSKKKARSVGFLPNLFF